MYEFAIGVLPSPPVAAVTANGDGELDPVPIDLSQVPTIPFATDATKNQERTN